MSQVNKIQSFKTFSELKMQEKQQRIQEEQEAKRNETAAKIAEALAEMEVTSIEELTEEQRKQLVAKLFNEDTAEEIEDKIEDIGEPKQADKESGEELEADMSEGNAFGEAVKKAKKAGEKEFEFEGETYKVEEGNAFIYAAAKAKAQGKEDFEFNGKSYKVTLKKDTGLKESYQLLITEGTRSQVGKIDKNGNITSVYVHWDGYPDNMLPKVKKYDAKGVGELIKLGKSGISSLEAEIGKKHDFSNPTKGWTIFYGRDRGETNNMISKGNAKNVRNYLKDVSNEAGAEYVYLYDERDGQWYMADTYSDKDLKPVDQIEESVVTEGNQPHKEIEKAIKGMKGVSMDIKGDTIIVSNKAGDEFIYSMNDADDVADFITTIEESAITEGKFDKKSLMKAMKKDDGTILVNGQEYIIYNPDNGNNDNAEMWGDKTIFALDQDGEEHEFKYSEIERFSESVVTEGATGDLNQLAKDSKDFKDFVKNFNKGYKIPASKALEVYLKTVYDAATNESVVNEAEIKSDDEFKEYAFAVLKKAFGDDFDEAKAGDVVDGILSKSDGDYGAAVGMLTGSLG
jgi:hypothetical protein